MEPKRTKYDTNPLDGKVAERADKSFASGAATEEVKGGPTRDIGRTENEAARSNPESEAPTRRIDGDKVTSYPSVFIPPKARSSTVYQPPPAAPQMNIYQPSPVAPANVYQQPPAPVSINHRSPPARRLGIPLKWDNLLTYLPAHNNSAPAAL